MEKMNSQPLYQILAIVAFCALDFFLTFQSLKLMIY